MVIFINLKIWCLYDNNPEIDVEIGYNTTKTQSGGIFIKIINR